MLHSSGTLLLCRLKPHTIVKCITTVVIGLVVGLLAVALGRITETTIVWKNTLLRTIVHSPEYSLQCGMCLAAVFHVGYSVLLVAISSSLVCILCPALIWCLAWHDAAWCHRQQPAAAPDPQPDAHHPPSHGSCSCCKSGMPSSIATQMPSSRHLAYRCSTVPRLPMEQACLSSWPT